MLRTCTVVVVSLVSLAAVFWMSRNAVKETMVFLDSFRLCVYYNQFLVALPSMRSRHARSSHAVLVRIYLQGYGLFTQIFLGEVKFATLCEDTTVQ